MFQRYKDIVSRASNGLQEPKVLAPFYINIPDMKDLFLSVSLLQFFSKRRKKNTIMCYNQLQSVV